MMIVAALLMMTEIPPLSERLGAELAASGSMASLLPTIAAKETGELIEAHPELSAAEQATLRRVARETFETGTARIHRQIGAEYARRLTIPELEALVAFQRTPAARKFARIMPEALAAGLKMLGPLDYKADTLKAYCAETGKLCGKK